MFRPVLLENQIPKGDVINLITTNGDIAKIITHIIQIFLLTLMEVIFSNWVNKKVQVLS